MRRGTWADDTNRLMAASHRGVIKARELLDLGVPESTTYRRCRLPSGWTLLLPGTVLITGGTPTHEQRLEAGLLHAGDGAMLTGIAACLLHGLFRLPPLEFVHLLIDQSRQRRSVGFAVLERTWRLPPPRERGGFPVAPLQRAVLDAARRITDENTVAAMLTEPVQRRMLEPEHLIAELEAGCRKGSALPRAVLRAVKEGVRSAAEFECREWWRSRPELPTAEWNVCIYDENGVFLAMVDCLVRELGFVWEIDSVAEHFATAEQVEQTNRRRRLLLSVGLVVRSTRPTERRNDPDGVLRDILDDLATAARTPAPRVVYEPRRP